MFEAALVYTTTTGDRTKSEDAASSRDIVREGGLTLRFEPEANRVYLGDVELDVTFAQDDPWDDIAAWFKVDCSYRDEKISRQLVYEIKVYSDHAMVSCSDNGWDKVDDHPSWCDGDEREFTSMGPFLQYLLKRVLPDYRASREHALERHNQLP